MVSQISCDDAPAVFSDAGSTIDMPSCKLPASAVQANLDLYRTIAQNFPNGAVLLFDPDLRYLVAEGIELATVELSSERLEGRTLHEAFEPALSEFFEPLYRSALAGEYRISRFQQPLKDGFSERFYNVHTLPVVNDRGEVIAGMAMTQNITEWQQAEVALRSQAERERLLGAMQERIRASLRLEEVMSTAVVEVRHFLQTDRVLFYSFEPDRHGVLVESTDPEYSPILGTTLEDTCFVDDYLALYQLGGIQAFSDIHAVNLKQCQVELLDGFDVQASLVVPVLQGDRLWGLIVAHHCRSPRCWQEADVQTLQQLSTQMAIALHQAELYHKLETELEERRVVERALRQSELQLQNRSQELEATLHELRSTQAQLIQGEKMSSLGQLVAGVAHEINNPVCFIHGNLGHADRYTQGLLELVQLYQKQYPDSPPQIQAKAEQIELEFVQKDFPKLLTSMRVGAERIREIIRSLRTFSRLDEAEVKDVDIHDGLDSTLLLLRNRLRGMSLPPIEVVKEYGGLPLVECYAGQLNQVFMNVLSNAIDALDERDQGRSREDMEQNPSTIWIRTEFIAPHKVKIRIADNGPGMAEPIRQRLFDPFFTTKGVGKGTGLGMSISYQIVSERHGGSLSCTSAPAQGAEFAIEIPIRQSL